MTYDDLALKGARLLVEMFEDAHPEHRGGLRIVAGRLALAEAARTTFVQWACRMKGCTRAEVEEVFELGPAPAMTSFLPPETPEERQNRSYREMVTMFLAAHPEHAAGVKMGTINGRQDVWVRPDVGKALTQWMTEKGLLTPEQSLGFLDLFQNADRYMDGKSAPDPAANWVGRK